MRKSAPGENKKCGGRVGVCVGYVCKFFLGGGGGGRWNGEVRLVEVV